MSEYSLALAAGIEEAVSDCLDSLGSTVVGGVRGLLFESLLVFMSWEVIVDKSVNDSVIVEL